MRIRSFIYSCLQEFFLIEDAAYPKPWSG